MSQDQTSFLDALLGPGLGRNAKLERIAGLLNWAPIGALAAQVRPGSTGRPPYAPLAMVKVCWSREALPVPSTERNDDLPLPQRAGGEGLG